MFTPTEIIIYLLAYYGAIKLGQFLIVKILYSSDSVKRRTIESLEKKIIQMKIELGEYPEN